LNFGNYSLAALPFAALVYLGMLFNRDLNFYKANGQDYSKNSGVPEFWLRLGSWRYVLSPQQRFRFGYPVFGFLLVGLSILFLLVKF
jgi:hypothetical protein